MASNTSRRKAFFALAIAAIAAILIFLAVGGVGENLVYYWSPSELTAAGEEARGATVRLGGLVVPGSVVRGDDGLQLDFAVTDGTAQVAVRARAVPPAMFREGVGVLVEGRMGADGVFVTERLMVKHDNQYQPPHEVDERTIEELSKSMQFEADDT
ncbi:MAG: cytochrome c maturation protein CcmE [bacterium]|nr:cytochrome c maturation protein CcmE [bacterium]